MTNDEIQSVREQTDARPQMMFPAAQVRALCDALEKFQSGLELAHRRIAVLNRWLEEKNGRIAELERERDQAIKERDAAIADMRKYPCDVCMCAPCPGRNTSSCYRAVDEQGDVMEYAGFKWRGVTGR